MKLVFQIAEDDSDTNSVRMTLVATFISKLLPNNVVKKVYMAHFLRLNYAYQMRRYDSYSANQRQNILPPSLKNVMVGQKMRFYLSQTRWNILGGSFINFFFQPCKRFKTSYILDQGNLENNLRIRLSGFTSTYVNLPVFSSPKLFWSGKKNLVIICLTDRSCDTKCYYITDIYRSLLHNIYLSVVIT